jgi:protein YIPF1/2
LHLDYYQKYFDVSTQDVLQRLLFSLIPFSDKLLQAIGDTADLYGPFWIYTTLIFILAFAENMQNYLSVGSDEFQYDFANIPTSFFVVYGVGFGAPLGLSFLMKYMNDAELKFREITCIYGYSYTSIVICALLCSIPVNILQWIAIISALVVNIGVLFFNLKKEFEGFAQKSKYLFVIGI